MDSTLIRTKATTMHTPYEDQLAGMLTQLDVKPTDQLEWEGQLCYGTTEADDSSEKYAGPVLPPPKPYFDRRTNATASAPMLMQGVLSRARSSSPNRDTCGASRAVDRRDVLQSRVMTQSMPNLHNNSRSMYNRGIGCTVLSNTAECGGGRTKKQVLRTRIDEFDSLLEDL
jgi:hypothetical protein